jgi:hypothetical protein
LTIASRPPPNDLQVIANYWLLLLRAQEFGMESFGFNWSFIIIGSGIGGFLFQPLQVHVYQSHAQPTTGADSSSDDCFGADCFKEVFVVSAIAGAVATAMSVVLSRHWRKDRQII